MFPSKLLLWKEVFTLRYFDLEYETNISSCVIWNDDRTLMIDLLLFQLAKRLNSQNTFETEIQNEIWHINLYMNIGSSNWHNWSYEPKKINFLNLYPFFQDYRHPNTWNALGHISWLEIERSENTCFQLLKLWIKKNQLKHKYQVRNRILLTGSSSSMMNYTCHYEVSTQKWNFYKNFN